MVKRGKFIVLEGLDGTGKTTQAALLGQRLNAAGIPAVTTAEPTDGAVGRLIREALSGRHAFTAPVLAALFLADRIDHNVKPVDGVKALLESGKTVISDRYYYSSFAYQSMDGGAAELRRVMRQNLDCPDIAAPDLCVFLDLSPEKSMERINLRCGSGAPDIFENINSLTAIRTKFHAVFEALSPEQNIVIIDADDTPENISDRIFSCAERLYYSGTKQ